MINTKSEEIVKLLAEGKTSAQIIARGYKPGTVYGTQRNWRRGKRLTASNLNNQLLSADKVVETTSLQIDSDPEIVKLKKDIRKVELEKQLERLKVPSEFDTLVNSAYEIGYQRQSTCLHFDNGICGLWSWRTADVIPQGIGEPFFKDKGTWRIKPSLLYCALCIGSVEKDIENIINDFSKIPLYGIRERFTCECGVKGMLAFHIKCTQCGKETQWGWWPKKS